MCIMQDDKVSIWKQAYVSFISKFHCFRYAYLMKIYTLNTFAGTNSGLNIDLGCRELTDSMTFDTPEVWPFFEQIGFLSI